MYFDNILYINLAKRPDRNQNAIDQLKKVGLDGIATRIDAVDGKALDLETVRDKSITSKGILQATNFMFNMPYMSLTRGSIGCALSHKKAYEQIVKNNKPSLIMEDDVTIDNDFVKKLAEYEPHFPSDADAIFLGYSAAKPNKSGKSDDVIFTPRKIYGLFGYIVTPKGAQKLLDMFPITYQIDSEITSHLKDLNVYAVNADKKIITTPLSEESFEYGSDTQHNIFHRKNILIAIGVIAVIVLIIYLLK